MLQSDWLGAIVEGILFPQKHSFANSTPANLYPCTKQAFLQYGIVFLSEECAWWGKTLVPSLRSSKQTPSAEIYSNRVGQYECAVKQVDIEEVAYIIYMEIFSLNASILLRPP